MSLRLLSSVLIFTVGAFAQAQPGGRPGPQPAPTTTPPKEPGKATAPKPAGTAGGSGSISTMQFDPETGWPIVGPKPAAEPATTPPAKVGAEPAAAANPTNPANPSSPTNAGGSRDADGATRFAAFERRPPQEPTPNAPPLVSGTELGSPLNDVFKAVRTPGEWKKLEGVVVWWRLTTFGEQGEEIGLREVTHTADCRFSERDRLEYQDGRTFGRLGAQVFAELRGMPWPTLNDVASQDLMLFGLHLRTPWLFGEARDFVVLQKDVEERSGERYVRIVLERRPPASLEIVGPELDPKPRDRFELLCDPSSGQPRELVHRFASSLATRRVLLEDWQEFEGVRIPHRRTYVDEAMRPKTRLEILRIAKQRTSERDFRLL
ncbi:MAG: hypothetical protein JNL12_10505 [Planctomycetes bacterium]|nr:hypothetical protein [Planctomycetota bacterium]